jgi:hypothetical protein
MASKIMRLLKANVYMVEMGWPQWVGGMHKGTDGCDGYGQVKGEEEEEEEGKEELEKERKQKRSQVGGRYCDA